MTPAAIHAIELLRGRHSDDTLGEPVEAEHGYVTLTSACGRLAARVATDGEAFVLDTRAVSYRRFSPTGVERAS